MLILRMKFQIIVKIVLVLPGFPHPDRDELCKSHQDLFFETPWQWFHWPKASVLRPTDDFHHFQFAKLFLVHPFHRPKS